MVDKSPRKRTAKVSRKSPAKDSARTVANQSALAGNENEKCLVPGCFKPASVRGMCNYCYQLAKANIRRGSMSWEELIAAGFAREAHIAKSPLLVALKKYREQIKNKHKLQAISAAERHQLAKERFRKMYGMKEQSEKTETRTTAKTSKTKPKRTASGN